MSESNVKTNVCSCFRTRLNHLPDMEPDPDLYGFQMDDVGHAWCDKTMRVMGPDRGMVSEEKCGPDRICFRSF